MDMEFKVEIVETLSRVVKVFAKNEEDAIAKVNKMYTNADIVLSYDDYDDYEIKLL